MGFLTNAEERLIKYFSDGGWEIYDGVEVIQDGPLTVCDIVLATSLNAKLIREDVWQVWKKREAIESALARIPADASLEDDIIPWEEVRALFQIVCAIGNVKGAKVTKILHKKRPALLPIYDSILEKYYEHQMKKMGTWVTTWRIASASAQFLVDYAKLFRDDLLANQEELHVLCSMMAARGWPITPVRAMEVLIWIETKPSDEYREGES